jgi:hypothetical protein
VTAAGSAGVPAYQVSVNVPSTIRPSATGRPQKNFRTTWPPDHFDQAPLVTRGVVEPTRLLTVEQRWDAVEASQQKRKVPSTPLPIACMTSFRTSAF